MAPKSKIQWPAAISIVYLAIRISTANLAPIMDCDEVFNYWEPLHFVLYGTCVRLNMSFVLIHPPLLIEGGVDSWRCLGYVNDVRTSRALMFGIHHLSTLQSYEETNIVYHLSTERSFTGFVSDRFYSQHVPRTIYSVRMICMPAIFRQATYVNAVLIFHFVYNSGGCKLGNMHLNTLCGHMPTSSQWQVQQKCTNHY